MEKKSFHPKYRPDIDGLRALAVISVVLYHAFPSLLPGGFAGVDVFFVISGYLISTILFHNIDNDTFSITDFYIRRIRRIFPALAVVLISVLGFGWLCLYPDEIQQLGKHVASSAGFIQNFTLWKESGYFDNSSETKPLLHIWSLGIEEQFYFIWPLLLLASSKFSDFFIKNKSNQDAYLFCKRISYLLSIILIFSVSFLLNLKSIEDDPTKTFYLPQYRFFELALGGLLAWWVLYHSRIRNKNIDKRPLLYKISAKFIIEILSFISLSLLIFIFIKFNKETIFPGKNALIPIFATAFIIWAGPHNWLNSKILSNKKLVWIGLISFPLYLWHWPILSFGRIIYGEIPPIEYSLASLIVSITLSWLTVKIIEKPFRFGSSRVNSKIAILCLVIIGLGCVGKWIQKSNGYPMRFKGASERYTIKYTQDLGRPENAKIMLIGDSHAAHFSHGIKEIVGNNLVADYTSSGCIPFFFVDRYDRRMKVGNCEREMTSALMKFEASENMTGIILSSMGPVYLEGTPFGNTGIERVTGQGLTLSTHPNIKNRWSIYQIGLTETLKRLSALNKKILFIYDIPELGFNIQDCLPSRPFSTYSPRENCFVLREDFEKRTKTYHQFVEKILNKFPNVKVFNPAEFLCDDIICKAKVDNNLIYRDYDHLSDFGSLFLVQKMKPLIHGLIEN